MRLLYCVDYIVVLVICLYIGCILPGTWHMFIWCDAARLHFLTTVQRNSGVRITLGWLIDRSCTPILRKYSAVGNTFTFGVDGRARFRISLRTFLL